MQSLTLRILLAVLVVSLSGADWREFRGPQGSSIAVDAKLPLKFSEKENIAWKTPLIGRGPSSPIVVNNRVFLTSSMGARQEKLVVECIDALSGKSLWRRQSWATGRTLTHPTSANAAPTPASDGQRVFAFYSSNDLICYDLDGNLQWYRGLAHDYPKAGNDVGMSSSPIVVGKTVVVQIENFGESFAAGLDAETGETLWKVDRKAISNWCSPGVLKLKDGRDVVLLQSPNILTAHDPVTGQQLWQYEAECANIPSVVSTSGKVFLPAKGLTVLDLNEGTAPKFVWESNQLNPGPASPIVDGNFIYAMNRAGVLTCADATTGKILWQQRIGGTFWATPVIAGGHMYCINQEGKAKIVKLGGEKPEVVGEGELGETIQGSPAVAGNALFIRSDKHLWKIAQ